jgi:hypothetical protein
MKKLLFIALILFSCTKEQPELRVKEPIRYELKVNSDEVFVTYSRNDTLITQTAWRVEGAGFMSIKANQNDRIKIEAVCTYKTIFKVFQDDQIIKQDSSQAGQNWEYQFYCK